MITQSTDRRTSTRHVGMLYPRPETSGSCRVAPGRGGQRLRRTGREKIDHLDEKQASGEQRGK